MLPGHHEAAGLAVRASFLFFACRADRSETHQVTKTKCLEYLGNRFLIAAAEGTRFATWKRGSP
jgi:hypothetical protein